MDSWRRGKKRHLAKNILPANFVAFLTQLALFKTREGEGDSRHPSESYPLSTGTISYSAYFWVKTSLPVHRSLRIDRVEPHTVGNGHFLGCVVSSSGDDYMPRRNSGSHSLRKTFGRSGRSPSVVSSDDETVVTRPTCHFCGQN